MRWINLEGVPDTCDIQKFVMQKLGLSFPENKSWEELAGYLYKYLKDKRYLLIFDNVSEPLDLQGIGIPVRKGKGVKVILTTRSLEVCKRMEAKVVEVKGLEWELSWSLFLEKAGETAHRLIMKYSRIEEIAKALVLKCDGLPEAIVTVGYAVANKENIEQWEHVLELLANKPWKVQGMRKLLSRLKSSYDRLDPKLKTCLLYCSLLPEGFPLFQEAIICYCIGEGLIDSYTEGDSQLGELKVASLLETGDDGYAIGMHPMVRAMVLWVACDCGERENKCLVQAGFQLKEAPVAELWHEAQWISFDTNDIRSLLEVPDCPKLETLLLQRNLNLENIHEDFFQFMPKLRVLDISHNKIEHFPVGICKLVNLQYLDLCNTKISSLPEELGALVNLRFLLLSSMVNLCAIPSGVLEKLCELKVLYMHNSYGKWKVGSVGAGVDFEELNKLKKLKVLGITIQNIETLEILANSYRLAKCTRQMYIKTCQGLQSISRTYFGNTFKDLQWLTVVHNKDLKEIKIDSNEWYLQKLDRLDLQNVPNVKIVWSQGCFFTLSHLRIYNCDMIESLIDCENIQKVLEDAGNQSLQQTAIEAFPNLKQLVLALLPRLKSLCSDATRLVALPSLQNLYIRNCPNLNNQDASLKFLESTGETTIQLE